MSDVLLFVEHLGARPAVCVADIVLEAGCPGRTGARRPPALRDLARKNTRSAERASRTVSFSGLAHVSHANISGRFSRETREARSRRTSDDKWSLADGGQASRRGRQRACAAHTSQQTVATQLT